MHLLILTDVKWFWEIQGDLPKCLVGCFWWVAGAKLLDAYSEISTIHEENLCSNLTYPTIELLDKEHWNIWSQKCKGKPNMIQGQIFCSQRFHIILRPLMTSQFLSEIQHYICFADFFCCPASGNVSFYCWFSQGCRFDSPSQSLNWS